MAEVLTLGEVMVVLHPHDPISIEQADALAVDVAGAESNVAIGLARLGHQVSLISRVGDDPFGRRIIATLQREGVDCSTIVVDADAPTGLYAREFLADGQRRVYYYRRDSAGSRLAPADLKLSIFAGARLLHLTGITPALSASCAAAVRHALDLAREAQMEISFDPNYRVKLWDAATARATLMPIMAQSDIVLLGHEDAEALLETTDEEAILSAVVAQGPKIVVLKRAERGAIARMGDTTVAIPAHPAVQAVDPVGAGDGFNAGFLSAWLRGGDLATALRLGAHIGAAAVGTVGDYNGYPRDVPDL
jgi:2-dehydro-3-deoxygluconokinase